MRKIEQNMLEAIRFGRDWQEGNTAVAFTHDYCSQFVQRGHHQPPGIGLVFLHGNHIATVTHTGSVRAVAHTFKQWPTSTTVSRLRALGIDCKGGNNPELEGVSV